MSDSTTLKTGENTAVGASMGTDAEGSWTPPASQADLDRIIGERLSPERADNEDLKERAAKHQRPHSRS